MSRHNVRTAKKKRSYKWCGDGIIVTPKTFVSTVRADITVLCPAVGDDSYSDVILERTIINIGYHRILNDELDSFGVLVAVQPVDQNDTSRPTQVLDSLSLSPNEYSAKNILMWTQLPVMPTMLEADNTAVPNSEIFHKQYDIPVKRRLDRTRQIVTLSMNTDISSVIRCFVQHRVLMSYGLR